MKTTCRIIAFLAAAALAAAAGAKESTEKLYCIMNYTITRSNAEIDLNGVQITRSEKETSYSVSGSADVGVWIHPGANTITVTVRPIEKKAESAFTPSVEISLATAREGQMSNEGKQFLSLSLPEKEADGSAATMTSPLVKQKTFTPSYIPPSVLWDKIKPVTLDKASREKIIQLVKDYHAAFVRKDAGALSSFLLFASTDMARIMHRPEEEIKNKLKETLREMVAEKGFAMEPLNEVALVLKPVVDGRIICVCDRNGENPVRTKKTPDGGVMSFPVYVSLIDGKWIIVR
ncbi:MAG: hypothetical protein JXA07_06670 [Spirochaetes bacterium]|nr:hypothetical protein [Spirochaetota bacterium]